MLSLTHEWSQCASYRPGTALGILAEAQHGRPILRPEGDMGQQRHHPQVAIWPGITAEVRQYVGDLIRDRLPAVEGDLTAARETSHGCRLHIDEQSLVKASELPLFRVLDNVVGGDELEGHADLLVHGKVGDEGSLSARVHDF